MNRVIALVIATAAAALTFSASASANVYCLPGVADPSCTNPAATIDAAFAAANANGGKDTIRFGAATYSISNQSGVSDGSGAVELIGAGMDQTKITGSNAAGVNQQYMLLGAMAPSSVSDLTFEFPAGAGNESTDTGLVLAAGASAQRVRISGPSAFNGRGLVLAQGASFTDGEVKLPGTTTQGVFLTGTGASITDSAVTAGEGIDSFPADGPSAVVSRVDITALLAGIKTEAGNVDVDDTLIDLGSSANAVGLLASNPNNGTQQKTINARHVTIVGGGANSVGVRARSTAPGASQAATVNFADSVISGPAVSLSRDASNSVANPSTATITTDHSNYDPATAVSSNGMNGAGAISSTFQTNFAPGFTDAASGDYSLSASSQLIDAGNPAAGGPVTDLAGNARVTDGNGDGTAVRDLGAYERAAVIVDPPDPPDNPNPPQGGGDTTPPDTAFAKAPKRKLKKGKAAATFTSTEAGSTFECSLDGAAFAPCTSPLKLKVKKGKHTLSVRAIDAAGNVDATPATTKFKRAKKKG